MSYKHFFQFVICFLPYLVMVFVFATHFKKWIYQSSRFYIIVGLLYSEIIKLFYGFNFLHLSL